MDIRELKKKQRAFYKSIGSIYCPILKDRVHFTSDGYRHLVYESNRLPRNINEQYMKLLYLSYAPNVIKNCLQIDEVRKFSRKIKSKLENGVHYSLVYGINNKKVRVIIEKINDGKYKFLSVMPHNKGSKNLINKKRLLRRS